MKREIAIEVLAALQICEGLGQRLMVSTLETEKANLNLLDRLLTSGLTHDVAKGKHTGVSTRASAAQHEDASRSLNNTSSAQSASSNVSLKPRLITYASASMPGLCRKTNQPQLA